jgi:cardiolipin synthase
MSGVGTGGAGRPGSVMPLNLPNLLTLSRVVAAPLVCALLMLDTVIGTWVALALYVYACVTDFLDGYVARRTSQQSHFGRMLDPIADKLLVACALFVLVGIGRLPDIHMIPALVILSREIVVSGLREYLARLNVGVPVTRLAKWKTMVQMVAIGFLVVGDHGPAILGLSPTAIGLFGLWSAALLTFVTGHDYLRAALGHVGGGVDYAAARPLERIDATSDAG